MVDTDDIIHQCPTSRSYMAEKEDDVSFLSLEDEDVNSKKKKSGKKSSKAQITTLRPRNFLDLLLLLRLIIS